jgi:hypothetical protein
VSCHLDAARGDRRRHHLEPDHLVLGPAYLIALALVASNPGSTFHVPLRVIASATLAMAAGTYSGGWRIIRTLGRRVTHLGSRFGAGANLTAGTAPTAPVGPPPAPVRDRKGTSA